MSIDTTNKCENFYLPILLLLYVLFYIHPLLIPERLFFITMCAWWQMALLHLLGIWSNASIALQFAIRWVSINIGFHWRIPKCLGILTKSSCAPWTNEHLITPLWEKFLQSHGDEAIPWGSKQYQFSCGWRTPNTLKQWGLSMPCSVIKRGIISYINPQAVGTHTFQNIMPIARKTSMDHVVRNEWHVHWKMLVINTNHQSPISAITS